MTPSSFQLTPACRQESETTKNPGKNSREGEGKNHGSFLELTPSHLFELIPLELTSLELTPDDLRLVLVF